MVGVVAMGRLRETLEETMDQRESTPRGTQPSSSSRGTPQTWEEFDERARVGMKAGCDETRESMNESTRAMVREWVRSCCGDDEATARYMRDTLRIGGIRECRELIRQAVAND